jgi:SAM-dependent methyltransferase
MESVACSLCGGTWQRSLLRVRDHLHPQAGRFRLVRCSGCGLVFVNPRPTPAEMGRFYPCGYGSRGQTLRQRGPSFYKRIPALLFGEAGLPESLAGEPRFAGRTCRVLDVGTGGGELLAGFHKLGWETTGIEPYCEPSALAEELGLDIRREPFELAELPASRYDLVLLSHVLEHMHDPLAGLRKAATLLAPGGLAYVEVPNYDSLCRRIFGPRWAHFEAPRHLSQFTPRTVSLLAKAAGLRLVKVRHIAASNALRDTLLRIFPPARTGGAFPGSTVNRLLRTPALKVAAALAAGLLSVFKASDHVGYYLAKD